MARGVEPGSGAIGARVTMAEIAVAAGVSVPTVSRVVNGRGGVSPAIRRRVESLLHEHGYLRRTGTGPTSALMELVFNDFDSPWAVEIIRGVESVLRPEGFGTVVSAVHHTAASADAVIADLRARGSAGAVLVTSDIEPPMHEQLLRLNVPTVVVDAAGVPSLRIPTVGATNWAGGRAATEHLLSLGHRRIAVVTGPLRILCSRARFDGHRAAMEAAGLSVDPALTREGTFYSDSGFLAAQELLALVPRPTAIVAGSDQTAFGAAEAARRVGLRVPADLSITGFDDLPESRWFSPPLTTVRQPLAEMGAHAARTVLDLVAGVPVPSPHVELATSLVLRESTAPPAG